jgi:hypothetical protein
MKNFHDGEKEIELDILMHLSVFSPIDYGKVVLVCSLYVRVLWIWPSLAPKLGRIDFINSWYNIEFIHAKSVPQEYKHFCSKNKGPFR